MAREVMGNIDLDPASNEQANKHFVKASRYYYVAGLETRWFGRIFMNPPYNKIGNQSGAGVWLTKLLHEYDSGHIEEAMALTKSVPSYNWWDDLYHRDWHGSTCLTKGLIQFVHLSWINEDGTITVPKGRSNKSKSASTFWYVGPHANRFKRIFSNVGMVISHSDRKDLE